MPEAGTRHTGAGRQRPAPVCVLALGLLIGSCAAAADPCPGDRIDERVRVSQVVDGDTVALSDGRRLRLIGINAPELGKDGAAPGAGALEARDQLRRLVFGNRQQLSLRFDQDRQDRYGRLLAHAFTADGRNVTAALLDAGNGAHLVVPPNIWQVDCYQQVAEAARRAKRGLWALPEYQPTPVAHLGLRDEGFRRVRGQISHLSGSAKAVWINFVGNFALRLDRDDLHYFSEAALQALPGTEVEAQGWLYARNGQVRMQLRHPAALEVVGKRPPVSAPGSLE